ncbi:GntR family transcriptional regulator [Virgibacillus siamensis]|uniref:GntR family transcriptional regulator n=1 Tax=Virgibacillus siamensis TaxID=480071 RepID=UPI000984AADE|nr:GntR family transcriptional regulator [Virgibacillus siamensis]
MAKRLDHGSFVPLYHQLKEILKEKIESGEWSPGEKIPSENEFRNDYEISRNTVKKALDDLVQEGFLRRIKGKGTFVSKPKFEQSLTGFYSFSKVMEKRGMKPKDLIISIETTRAKRSIAKQLQIGEEEEVIALRRLRKANDEPIILETSYIPKKLIPGLSREQLENYSLYDLMEKEFGIIVTKAKEIFEPVLIRDYESKYLEVQEGYPALLLDRTARNKEGLPVEFCRSIVRGDRCRFYTELM